MAVQLYQHTDPQAPVLTPDFGSLISLLEHCLVLGYGSKPPLGWEITKSDNGQRAAFRSLDIAATGSYLYITDDLQGNVAGIDISYAHGVGIEAGGFGGFDVNGDPVINGPKFPREAQVPWGTLWMKTREFDQTSEWHLIGDERTFYLFVFWQNPIDTGLTTNGFGDIVSYKPIDPGEVFVAGNTVDEFQQSPSNWHFPDRSATDITTSSKCLALDHIGDTPVGFGFQFSLTGSGTSIGGISYPNPPSGGLLLTPAYIREPDNAIRGVMPGLYLTEHDQFVFSQGELITGIAGFEGKTLIALQVQGGVDSEIFIDVTGPWR